MQNKPHTLNLKGVMEVLTCKLDISVLTVLFNYYLFIKFIGDHTMINVNFPDYYVNANFVPRQKQNYDDMKLNVALL